MFGGLKQLRQGVPSPCFSS